MSETYKWIVALSMPLCLLCFPFPARADLTDADRKEVNSMISAAVDKALKDKERDDLIAALKKRIDDLVAIGGDEFEDLKYAVDATKGMTKKDDVTAKYYVDFTKMADIPTFREKLSKVVQAKLELPPSTSGQVVLINGTKWNLQPVKSYVWVPLGNVVLHFPAMGRPEVIPLDKLSWNQSADDGKGQLSVSSSDAFVKAVADANKQ